MSTIFNEQEADQAVNKILLAIKNKELRTMDIQYFKNDQGDIFQAVGFERVNRDELESKITDALIILDVAREELAAFDAFVTPEQVVVEETIMAEFTAVEVPAPVVDPQPEPTPEPVAAPEPVAEPVAVVDPSQPAPPLTLEQAMQPVTEPSLTDIPQTIILQ